MDGMDYGMDEMDGMDGMDMDGMDGYGHEMGDGDMMDDYGDEGSHDQVRYTFQT